MPSPPSLYPCLLLSPQVALPGFLNRTDAEQWLLANYGYRATGQTGANRRALVDVRQGLLVFSGLRGQNLVYRNVRWSGGGAGWGRHVDRSCGLTHGVSWHPVQRDRATGAYQRHACAAVPLQHIACRIQLQTVAAVRLPPF